MGKSLTHTWPAARMLRPYGAMETWLQ